MSATTRPLSTVAWRLGYGGLIPFVGLAVAVVLKLDLSALGIADVTGALLQYGAVIISFIGAIHWGVAVGSDEPGNADTLFIYSVLPALIAWLLMFFPQKFALTGMAVTVVAAFVVDRIILFEKLHPDYRKLRIHLTCIVALALAVAALFS